MDFPNDFLWGCATASYQVEGATEKDGRTPSIWDTFAKKPGAVEAGNDGSVACDQYHRYEEDVELIASLGFEAYRFSIAWPRIIPDGIGAVNPKGVDYYVRLCKALHAKGIKAVATIYHWDLPQSLQDAGGWPERRTAYAFAEYAKACFTELGPYVDQWITLNEPWCSSYLSYLYGEHAPGHQDMNEALRSVHHLNLAHGLAMAEYKKSGLTAPIGITLNPQNQRPATKRKEDVFAAELAKAINTDVFLHPLVGKGYPKVLKTELGIEFPVEKGDMELIAQKVDFIGINFYNENPVVYDKDAPFHFSHAPYWQTETDMGWPITPQGLARHLRYFHEETGGIPLYITENGCAAKDELVNGRCHDIDRCEYIREHLRICQDVITEGVNLKGYYVWSLLDNFEWAWGYAKRFGIVYVDYKTLKRYPKDSAYMLRDVIAGYGDL